MCIYTWIQTSSWANKRDEPANYVYKQRIFIKEDLSQRELCPKHQIQNDMLLVIYACLK